MLNTITRNFPMPKKIDFGKFYYFVSFWSIFRSEPTSKYSSVAGFPRVVGGFHLKNLPKREKKMKNHKNNFFGHWKVASDHINCGG